MTTPLNVIAERLSKEMGSWSAVEYQEHQDFQREAKTPPGSSMFASSHETIRYVETGLGERLFDCKIVTPEPEHHSISIDYCDGELAANFYRRVNISTDRDQVIIKQVFGNEQNGASHRPFPYNSLFVGDQPLNEAITRAVPIGTIRYLDRDCDRVLFAKVSRGGLSIDYYYDLDPETSFPLRISGFLSEASRQRDLPDFIWSAGTLEMIEGHPVATRSELIQYEGTPEARHVYFRRQTVVDSVSFNHSYPKEMFRPTITADTKVFDTVKKLTTIPKTKPAAPTAASSSIRADDGEGMVPAAGIALLVGLALIIASVVAFIRRR